MEAATQALPSVQSREPGLDGDSSNISSPLSDVVDKDGESPDITMNLDNDAKSHEDTDSDSNLSDVAETEAETERLFDTPRVQRQRDVLLDEFSEDHIFERSPTKPHQAVNSLEDTQEDDAELSDVEGARPLRRPPIDEPLMEPGQGHGSATRESSKGSSQERKRKRSAESEGFDVAEPMNKRPELAGVNTSPGQDENSIMAKHDFPSGPINGDQTTPESTVERCHIQEGLHIQEELLPRESRGSRKNTRNGRQRNVRPQAEEVDDDSGPAHSKGRDAEAQSDEHRAGDEGAEKEEEPEYVNKSAEEAERKQAAYEELTNIDGMFGLFTDRLYKDRLERLEEEERSLLAEVPYHPEYLNMIQCIDERLQKKLAQFKKEHEYQMDGLERVGASQRSQIWAQFYQEIRETRQDTLDALNRQFYDVQAARRSAHGHPDQIVLFPKDAIQRTKNALSYNAEVSTLSAIAKYEGFPAAPTMRGATPSEVEDDLGAIKLAKRRRQPTASVPTEGPAPAPALPLEAPHKLNAFPRALDSAGERFIQENAWANPKHPAHKMLPPGDRRSTPRATSSTNRLSPSVGGATINPPPSGHGSPGSFPARSAQIGPPGPRPMFYGTGIRVPEQIFVPPASELAKPGPRVAAGN